MSGGPGTWAARLASGKVCAVPGCGGRLARWGLCRGRSLGYTPQLEPPPGAPPSPWRVTPPPPPKEGPPDGT